VQSQLAPTAQTGFFMYMMVPNQINLFAMMFMTSMGAGPFKNLFSMGQGACVRALARAATAAATCARSVCRAGSHERAALPSALLQRLRR